MIRVGVIGLGFMGRAHITRYAKMQDAAVVMVSDREAERLRPDYKAGGNLDLGAGALDWSAIRVTTSAEELIRDPEVDVVDICLPTFLHKQYAMLALQQGKHVICEKPLALNPEDADEMVAAARAAHRRIFSAQVVRFWPEYMYLQKLIATGELGILLFLSLSRQSAPSTWSWNNWSADASRSGGVLDVWIHDVDWANFCLGMPRRVFAQAVGRQIVLATYDYDGGPKVAIYGSRALAPGIGFEARYEAVFEGGMVRYLSSDKPTLSVYRGANKTPEHPELAGDAYFSELECFVDCIRHNQDGGKLVDPASARDSIRLSEAAFKSAATGVPVRI